MRSLLRESSFPSFLLSSHLRCFSISTTALIDHLATSSSSSPLSLPHLRTLQSLNLPGALQAVERPMGLPPSLLGMAEEVRRERGPERVRKMMDNIKSSRRQADVLLNEVNLLCPCSCSAVDATELTLVLALCFRSTFA